MLSCKAVQIWVNSAHFNFPTIVGIHTVTKTTIMLHQYTRLKLNKTRCEWGTWSLYSPLFCLWHHASSNWPGQIDLRQSYLKTIVLHTSFLWAVLLLNEESEMLWPNYYRLACLIYLVFMWMLTFVAEVENKREGRAQTGNIWSKIEKSGPQCDDVFCGKDTWLTEAKIFTQIISIIFFNIFKNS